MSAIASRYARARGVRVHRLLDFPVPFTREFVVEPEERGLEAEDVVE